jgi:hypothetical protein
MLQRQPQPDDDAPPQKALLRRTLALPDVVVLEPFALSLSKGFDKLSPNGVSSSSMPAQ